MDSDLSLLEITDEDDSLLHIPKDDSSVNNPSLFSCSPLNFPRSLQSHGRVGPLGYKKLSSSVQDDKNKENNMIGNKSDAPKLNVEPQQMKRKKKGNAYNLRKSLAWDRAFFTEQGVLNPLELSRISGSHSRANSELTMIDEEEENALEGDADIAAASPMLQDIEENLFKPSASSTPAPASLAKRKVLAGNNINRNNSKLDACPRPIASSSLKKPDTSKAARKDLSKVSKIPLPKTHVPVITTTARSGASGSGCSKRNQQDHSAAYVQKNAAVKGLSRNQKSVTAIAKSDVADKSSATRISNRLAGKNIHASISESHPPPRLQHQLITEVRKGLELHPPSRVCDTGDKKQPTQSQTVRPSGLRMPSPSLGFFSQQKASSSHSIVHKSTKPGKPVQRNIPKSQKVEMGCVKGARSQDPPGKSSETVKGETKKCTPKVIPTDVKPEPCLKVENNQKIEAQCHSLHYGEITEQGKNETIPEHVNNSKNLILGSDMDDHLKTKVDEDQPSEPHSMCYSSIQRTSIERVDLSTSAQTAIKHEEDLKTKPLVCDAKISNEGLVPQAENGSSSNECRLSGDLKVYKRRVKIAQVNSSLRDSSEAELGVSLEQIFYKDTEVVKDGGDDSDKNGVDAQLHLSNANLSSSCNDSSQLISEAINQQPQDFQSLDRRFEEQSENINQSMESEINLRIDSESHTSGCLVHAKTSSPQDSPKDPLVEVIGASESVSSIAEMEDCKHTGDTQSGYVHRRSVDTAHDQLIDSKIIQDTSSRSTSLHYALSTTPHDVIGNFDQEARNITSPETNNILSENENLLAIHSPLLDDSDSIEAPAIINLDTEDFCRGAETPSGLNENTLLVPIISETDDAEIQIENVHVKEVSVASLNENPVTSSDNDPGTSLGKYHFPLVESINKESPPELQSPGLVSDVDFLPDNFNVDLLPADRACSEEIMSDILFEGVLQQCSNNESEDVTVLGIKDGSLLDMDERTEHFQMDGADQVTAEIVEVDPNHKVDKCIDSSIEEKASQIDDMKCNERYSLSASLESLAADNLISHVQIRKSSESGSLKRKSLSDEAEINVSSKDEICNANVQDQIREDSDELFHPKKSGTRRKHDVPTVIPPPNVAPFSDEWLAAMEAAGEEVLTMKRGAVQNSPTEKPQHEPSPWSPVRRKNQEIGPYDCTKHTNMNIPDSC